MDLLIAIGTALAGLWLFASVLGLVFALAILVSIVRAIRR